MADTTTEKPLPDPLAASIKRPGTSGTELNLREEKTKASTAYQRAQRAEAAYRAKRQARNARQDIAAAKTHLRESFKQAGLGLGCVWRVMKGLPGVVREKREGSREKSDTRKKERAALAAVEEKKKLEKKLKKVAGEEAVGEPAVAIE